MAITTVNDLITYALKCSGVVGVGQTPEFEDSNDALSSLNLFIGQINRERWLINNLIDTAFVSTGAQSYTVGTGLEFNTIRPDRIQAAYCRLLPESGTGTCDLPLTVLEAHEDYAQIVLKQLSSIPGAVFYDSAWPNGVLYPWPVPPANQYEVHIITKTTFPTFPSLATAINLPPEYADMLLWNLVCRLKPAYQMQPDQTAIALAKRALNVVRGANQQVPRLGLPSGVGSVSQGAYPWHGIWPSGLY